MRSQVTIQCYSHSAYIIVTGVTWDLAEMQGEISRLITEGYSLEGGLAVTQPQGREPNLFQALTYLEDETSG